MQDATESLCAVASPTFQTPQLMNFLNLSSPRRRYWPRFVLPTFLFLSPHFACAAEPERAAAPMAGLTASVETGHPVHVIVPGGENKLALVLKNDTAQPVAATLHLRVESFDGSAQTEAVPVRIPARGTMRHAFSKKLLGSLGIKWVEWQLEQGGQKSAAQKQSFVYMKPSGPTPGRSEGFLFGIAYGASPDNRSEKAALASALAGVKVVRTGVSWGATQPKEGEWKWDFGDRIFEVHEKQNIEVQLIVGGGPAWAVSRTPGPEENAGRIPPRLDAWRPWISAQAKRYGDRVRFWEIWNEPDIGFFQGTTAEYLALQRAAFEEIKKVTPQTTVMTGGFTSLNHHGIKKEMLETVLRDGQDAFEMLAYHKHGPFPEFAREMDTQLLPLMRKHDALDKPLYFTETAMDTRYGEQHQAATLVKKVALAWSRGARAYTWFNLHDDRRSEGDPRRPGYTYGLLTRDGQPKAVYAAYNALTAALRDKKFVKQLALPAGQWGFLFQDEAEQVIVAWNEDAAQSGSHLVLETDATAVAARDMMGNEGSRGLVANRALLQIGETPHYLVLRGARREPKLAGALAAPSGTFNAIPGQTLQIGTELSNPLPTAQNFAVAWSLPQALGGGTGQRTVAVAPQSRVRVPIAVPVPAALKAKYGDVEMVAVRYEVAGTPWNGTLRVPVTAGVVMIPRGDFGQWTFSLERQEQVINLREADPNSDHLLWKGRDDLNAKVWLAHDGQALKLKVLVVDDIASAATGEKPWEGDSVQFALQGPGQTGAWQVALSDVNGQPRAQVVETPQGLQAQAKDIGLKIERKDAQRTYEVTLPDAKFGLTPQVLSQGVRFNLLVNDNDGAGRKGWLQIAPGLGREFDPTSFPLLVSQPAK